MSEVNSLCENERSEAEIRLLCRKQWRRDGYLHIMPEITMQERIWWYDEAFKIDLEEAQSA